MNQGKAPQISILLTINIMSSGSAGQIQKFNGLNLALLLSHNWTRLFGVSNFAQPVSTNWLIGRLPTPLATPANPNNLQPPGSNPTP